MTQERETLMVELAAIAVNFPQHRTVCEFRRRRAGLAKVRGEWDLVCLALNAKRLHALIAA